MSVTYLEYSKFILQKVSFDVALFEKELRKCLTHLVTDEVRQLKRWCRATFPKSFRRVLSRCFRYFKWTRPSSSSLAMA